LDRDDYQRNCAQRWPATRGLGLQVDKLGQVGVRKEANKAEIEENRIGSRIGALILEHDVRLPNGRLRRRRHRVHCLYELDVVTVNGDRTSLVRIVGVPDAETIFSGSLTKEIFRTVLVLIDPNERLGNAVDGDRQRIREHTALLG
jgi:hypothetical protein